MHMLIFKAFQNHHSFKSSCDEDHATERCPVENTNRKKHSQSLRGGGVVGEVGWWGGGKLLEKNQGRC